MYKIKVKPKKVIEELNPRTLQYTCTHNISIMSLGCILKAVFIPICALSVLKGMVIKNENYNKK